MWSKYGKTCRVSLILSHVTLYKARIVRLLKEMSTVWKGVKKVRESRPLFSAKLANLWHCRESNPVSYHKVTSLRDLHESVWG